MNLASLRLISIEKNWNAFECESHCRVPRQLAANFLSAKTAIGPYLTKSESSNNFETSDSDSDADVDFEEVKTSESDMDLSWTRSLLFIRKFRNCAWYIDDGDGISILVTSFGCWCPTPM